MENLPGYDSWKLSDGLGAEDHRFTQWAERNERWLREEFGEWWQEEGNEGEATEADYTGWLQDEWTRRGC